MVIGREKKVVKGKLSSIPPPCSMIYLNSEYLNTVQHILFLISNVMDTNMKKIWRDVLIRGSLSTLIIKIATFSLSMFTPSKYSMERFCQAWEKCFSFVD